MQLGGSLPHSAACVQATYTRQCRLRNGHAAGDQARSLQQRCGTV
jgi:hypothetical protein